MTLDGHCAGTDVLVRAAEIFAVTSPMAFVEDGEEHVCGDALLPALTDRIYWRCHLRQDGPRPVARPAREWEQPDFVARLRPAAQGRGYHWSGGWRHVDRHGEKYRVERAGLVLTVTRAQWRTTTLGETEEAIEVRMPNVRPYASPGYLTTTADSGPPRGGTHARAYFNVHPQNAADLFTVIRTALDARRERYVLKALNDPSNYGRPDAAVLYLEGDCDDLDLHPLISRVPQHWLTPFTPGFSLRIAPGVGVAAEPTSGHQRASLGMHRSGLVAQGLVTAWQTGAVNATSRLRSVCDVLREADVELDSPHRQSKASEPS